MEVEDDGITFSYTSKLSALDGIRTATAPQRVLLSHFYWMSLQTMQHDIQLLTVDQSLQEVDEIWKQYPELQNYLGSTVSREDSRKAADILLEFAKRCIVKGFPHRRNQELYSNFGKTTSIISMQCLYEVFVLAGV